MVLVEVVQLVIDIDWWLNIRVNFNVNGAWGILVWIRVLNTQFFYRILLQTRLVILMCHILYFVAHNVESHSQEEEEYTKDSEDNHG